MEKNVKGDAYEYEARLYDIQLHTRISVGIAITYANNDYFEGKYSGANGFTTGAGTLDWVKLQDVRGQFQINEPLLRNGVDIKNPLIIFTTTFLALFPFSYQTNLGRNLVKKIYLGKTINYAKYKGEACSNKSSQNWIVGDSHTGYFSPIVFYATKGDCKIVREPEKSSTSYSFLFNPSLELVI